MSRPVGLGEVEPEALLAPVRVLHEHRHLAAEAGDAGRAQAARGVAPGDVLDLDHLGAPVGEDGGRRGHEGVLGDLEDADALHHIGHASPLSALAGWLALCRSGYPAGHRSLVCAGPLRSPRAPAA